MKRKLQIIISASAASVLAISALAQTPPDSQTGRSDYNRDRTTHARRSDQLNGAAKASDLIGMTVKNYHGEKLGKVEDLAVDVESGRIVQVIISTGGFAGVGDRSTAVPPGALHHDAANKVVHLEADQAKLKDAPKFEMSKWAECCDADHLSSVYRYYSEEPALGFIHRGDANLGTQRIARSNTNDPTNTISTRRADGTWTTDRSASERQSMIPVSRLSHVQRASKLMGTPVKNLHDEKLGKAENLLVDLSSGRIVAVVISSGGFLGMGDELSAVPPTALTFNADRDTLQLDTSKEMLSKAPHFKANQWPDFAEPSYAGGVYRAYNVEPYFTSGATTDTDNSRRTVRDRDHRPLVTTEPDNTGRNVRDRKDQTLTPLDQGNSQADVNTTAQIRKEIIANKGMSVNARNVKIITKDGRVTLRGPVNSEQEKSLIGEIAGRNARAENVDNQLEVKLNTTSSNP